MNKKRVSNKRNYRHKCPADNFSETQISVEICPKCGMRGEFNGWMQSINNRIVKKQMVLGFPCVGVQMTFLPVMTRSCRKCKGEGILQGDDFDYECPECEGLGAFINRTEDEMRKIRRWVLIRHKKLVRDNKAKLLQEKSQLNKIPDNPVYSKNPKIFIRKIMGIFEYYKKFSTRNSQIGEIMLRFDDHGWDVIMPVLELWENSYRGISPDGNSIGLTLSLRKNASTIITFLPQEDGLPQRLIWNRKSIRKRIGLEKETELWRQFPDKSTQNNELIRIDKNFKKEDLEKIISNLLNYLN